MYYMDSKDEIYISIILCENGLYRLQPYNRLYKNCSELTFENISPDMLGTALADMSHRITNEYKKPCFFEYDLIHRN